MDKLGNQAINREELSLLRNGTLAGLNTTKSLLEVHLKHLIHILLQNQRHDSSENLNLLRRSAEEINRTLHCFSGNQKFNSCSAAPEFSGSQETFPSNTKRILKEVVAVLKKQHYLDHLILIESIPSDLPSVKADSINLEEIFYNLIVNAAQATLDEGGRLTIDASYHALPDPRIAVKFRDNGYGIPEEAMPYIFDPYFSNFSPENGVGSGLYAVKQLVERNEGQISVHSCHPSGLSVTVCFPAVN